MRPCGVRVPVTHAELQFEMKFEVQFELRFKVQFKSDIELHFRFQNLLYAPFSLYNTTKWTVM